ncbi:MAG: HNH endonuclease, partial [Erysipelotrichaceae bacterium]|nr:HNH endonuclease [Erysipelotrichaceae bacterium]
RSSGGIKGSGGLIALGTIISMPVLISGEESKEYWNDEGWLMPENRVQIKINIKDLDNLNLRREALIVQHELSSLTILKMPQNTNYEIKQTQFEAILQLFEDGHNNFHYPLQFDSWTIYSDRVFVKTMDKSVFINKGSGIPKEMVPFWGAEDLQNGGKIEIRTTFHDKTYDMKITRENLELGRYRLFWHSDFEEVISSRYPATYQMYKSYQNVEEPPKMRFEKLKENRYVISLIDEVQIINDIKIDGDEKEVSQHLEGAKKAYYGYKYERDPKCRKAAIEFHGTTCAACGLNFERMYGLRGEGFIEIHHIKPLFIEGKESKVDPITDLIPLCPNCHRMVHRDKENILTIDELQGMIR